MKYLALLTVWCAALLPGAFGQSASNTVAGMGYLYPSVAVAPGQLISVFVEGNVQGDIGATVQGLVAPVLEVRSPSDCPTWSLCSSQTAITIQIPFELQPGCSFTNPACNLVLLTQLIVTVNGAAGPPVDLTPLADRVHILTSCDTVVPGGSGVAGINLLPCTPLVTHADGSPVTSASPAQSSEELVAYAVGLGLTNPAVPTGKAAAAATPTSETFALDFNFRPNALATKPIPPSAIPVLLSTGLYTPLYSGLVPGYVGLYQINFIVPQPPAGILSCSGTVQSNLTVSVGGQTSFDGVGICVAPAGE